MRDGLRYDRGVGDAIAADIVLDLRSLVLGLLQYPLNIATPFETTEEEIVVRDSCETTQEIRLTKVLDYFFPTTVNDLEFSKVVQVG